MQRIGDIVTIHYFCILNSNESVMNRIYLWLLTALLVFSTVGVNAQTGLAGRTYYNANIMAESMNNATQDMDKKMAERRREIPPRQIRQGNRL